MAKKVLLPVRIYLANTEQIFSRNVYVRTFVRIRLRTFWRVKVRILLCVSVIVNAITKKKETKSDDQQSPDPTFCYYYFKGGV